MRKIFIALFALFSFSASFAQPMHLLPSANLVHWYPFCTATDLFDRTFTGFDLLGANLTPTTDRYGHTNRAYQFNGINSEMHYSTTFTIPAFGIADFTYSCHIYPTAAQDAIILYNGNPALNGLGIIMNNGTFGGGVGVHVSMLFGGIAQSTGFNVPLSTWSHLIMRRNGNSYLLYLNGVLADTYIPPTTPGYIAPTGVFQLGNDFTGSDQYFAGKIDDIAIYERQVSTPDGIKIRDFDPNIFFTLGADTTIGIDTFYIGGRTTIDTSNSLSTSLPSNTFNPTLGYKYQWSTGPIDTQTTDTMIFTRTATTSQTHSLTISRLYSCPFQDAITVTRVVPVINIGRDTTICTGATLVLNPTPSPGVSYVWNTGATTPSILADPTTSATYWVDADSVSTVGGVTLHFPATDTVVVNVSPPTHVTLGPDILLCQGVSQVLSSSDTYFNPTYRWSDGITTTPTFTASTLGKHTYWLEVTDSACTAADTITVTIVYDTLTVFTPDTAICAGDFVIIRATSSPDINYQWLPTSGIPVSNVPSTTITPDTSAMYVLEGTITLGGELLACRTRDSIFIEVQPIPKINLGGNRFVCKYDTLRISSGVTPSWYNSYIYDWSPGTFLSDSTGPYTVFTAGDTTNLVLQVSTPAGCSSIDSIMIWKLNGDFASIGNDTALCPGTSILLKPTSTEPGVTTYVWHPATYLSDSTAENAVVTPINDIDYTGIATSSFGCKDTIKYSIRMYPAAVIYLIDSVVLFPGESYQLLPITNAHFHTWSPPIGLNDTDIINPVAQPPVNTIYKLRAQTEDGCVATDSVFVRVMENSVISVANAYIPGGYSGNLKVQLRGVARLRHFRIFNRWGVMVYESTDINEGWDGTLDGKPQPAGVYVYEAEAATAEGKIIHKQGNITLLK